MLQKPLILSETEAILQVLFILEREIIIKENKVNMIHFVTYLITQSSGFKCSSCN